MSNPDFMDDFRRFFVRGLGALVPTLLTIAILVWSYRLINDNVGFYITQALLQFCKTVRSEPATVFVDPETDALRYGTPINAWDDQGRRLTIEYRVIENYQLLRQRNATGEVTSIIKAARASRNDALWRLAFAKYHLHVLGFLIAIILVYFMGFFLASFMGRAAWRTAESFLRRIPLIRAVYSNVKQVTDFLLSERTVEFSGVVAVQYPRKGIWSIGLRTGEPMKSVQGRVSQRLITVFVPSSPTPFTGYVVQVPREEAISLAMTIDEALRFTVSGGVIKPGEELIGLPTQDARRPDESQPGHDATL